MGEVKIGFPIYWPSARTQGPLQRGGLKMTNDVRAPKQFKKLKVPSQQGTSTSEDRPTVSQSLMHRAAQGEP